MNAQTFTTIRTAQTPMEAGLLIGFLENAGFHPLALNTSSNFTFAGAEIEYSMRVPAAEAAEARELLNSFDSDAA